jgi:hypothetical protein
MNGVKKVNSTSVVAAPDQFSKSQKDNRELINVRARRNHNKEIDNQNLERMKKNNDSQTQVEYDEYDKLLDPVKPASEVSESASAAPLNSKNLSSTQHIVELTKHLTNEQWAAFLQNAGMQDLCPIIDSLVKEIEADENIDTETILDKLEPTMQNKNKAQIYVGLNYLQSSLTEVTRQNERGQGQSEEILDELEEACTKYAKQNFEYLVNYFVPLEEDEKSTTEAAAAGVSSDIASLLKTGKLSLAGIKQVIAFVTHSFRGEIEKLMSLYIAIKVKNLDNLTAATKLVPEYKEVMQEIRAIRWVLQAYKEIIKFETILTEHQAKVSNKKQLLQAIIDFIDTKFLSDFVFNNLIRNNFINLKPGAQIAKLFINLVRAIPISVIYGPQKTPEILKFLEAYSKSQQKPEVSKLISKLAPPIKLTKGSVTNLPPLGQVAVLWMYLLQKNQLSELIAADKLPEVAAIEQYMIAAA